MDESVEALSSAMGSLSPPSAHTANRQTECSFTDLPNELRNRIYELVVFHGDNNGIIALSQKQKGNAFQTMINGQAATGHVVRSVPGGPFRHPLAEIWHTQLDTVAQSPDQNLRVVHVCRYFDPPYPPAYQKREFSVIAHICSNKCTMQPAITRVSRQIRMDSLAVFYGVHRFHLEIDTYNRLLAPLPIRWMWAIGDINLANIKQLCLAVMSPDVWTEQSLGDWHRQRLRRKFDVLRHGASSDITFTFGWDKDAISQSLGGLRLEHIGSSTSNVLKLEPSARRDIVEFGYKVMESGLCVQAMERVLEAMDPRYKENLVRPPMAKDASALGLERFQERYQFC